MWPFNSTIAPILRSSLQFLKHVRFSELAHNTRKSSPNCSIPAQLKSSLPPLAQRMLDDGVFDPSAFFPQDPSFYLQNFLAKCNNAEERHEAVVSFSLLNNVRKLAHSSCENCLYQKKRCICGVVDHVQPKHKLWVFQHHGEFGRSNNTGSLLCLVAGAKRAIRGIREQQDEMLDHIAKNEQSTVILFPSAESTTIDHYMMTRSQTQGHHSSADPLTLVLLDGTSRQAKNLDRFMPEVIPRVRIRQTQIRSWLDPIRRQTEEHRVCTAQGKLGSWSSDFCTTCTLFLMFPYNELTSVQQLR